MPLRPGLRKLPSWFKESLRGREGEGRGGKGKGRSGAGRDGEGSGGEVDSYAQLEQGRRLAKAGPD